MLKRRVALIAAACLAALCPMLMAPSGGFPSQPQFVAVGVGTAPGSAGTLSLSHNAASASDRTVNATAPSGDSRLGTLSTATGNAFIDLDTAGTANWVIGNRRSDGHLVISNAQDFSVPVLDMPTGGATTVPTAVSGTFSSTLTNGCTTTPSATVTYVKTGNVVTLRWPATSWSCTSNALAHNTDASIPAAIRPSTSRCASPMIFENNGVLGVLGEVYVTSAGVLQFGTASNTDCSLTGASSVNAFAVNDAAITYTTN